MTDYDLQDLCASVIGGTDGHTQKFINEEYTKSNARYGVREEIGRAHV